MNSVPLTNFIAELHQLLDCLLVGMVFLSAIEADGVENEVRVNMLAVDVGCDYNLILFCCFATSSNPSATIIFLSIADLRTKSLSDNLCHSALLCIRWYSSSVQRIVIVLFLFRIVSPSFHCTIFERGFGGLPDQQAFGGLPNAMLAFSNLRCLYCSVSGDFLLMSMPPTLALRCATTASVSCGGYLSAFDIGGRNGAFCA